MKPVVKVVGERMSMGMMPPSPTVRPRLSAKRLVPAEDLVGISMMICWVVLMVVVGEMVNQRRFWWEGMELNCWQVTVVQRVP